MTVYLHELRQGRRSLLIWSLSVGLFAALCIFMYPSMANEMDSVSEMFASMGAFTAAFGMDRLNIGSLVGFYAVECGNIVGLGGAFYAAIAAVNMLSKEESCRTAEFLFTHPVSRGSIVFSKLLAVLTEVFLLDIAALVFSAASVICIGEELPCREILLLSLAYFICHIETALICFGISAFSRKSSYGVGLGLALVFYFMNLLANISEDAKICKYLSPFGYTEGSDIVTAMSLDGGLVALGLGIGISICVFGFLHYTKKDLSC